MLMAMLLILAVTVNSGSSSQLDRMSQAFAVANKPYTPVNQPKPKGKTKDKFFNPFALIKTSGIGVVGISGKIGGTVFNLGGSQGAFARNWAKPRNVRNTVTQFVRGLFSGISTAWRALTNAQVSAWNGAASLYTRVNVFGDNKSLKGNTAFQRVNNIRASLGLAAVSDPPALVPASFVITNAVGTADVSGTLFNIVLTDFFAGVVLPADTYIKAYGTTQRPISQSYFGKSAYRYFGFYIPTDSTNPLDIYADYIAEFGALRAGTKVSIALEVVKANATDFYKSGLFYVTVEVVA